MTSFDADELREHVHSQLVEIYTLVCVGLMQQQG